jgi:hypothetical protein
MRLWSGVALVRQWNGVSVAVDLSQCASGVELVHFCVCCCICMYVCDIIIIIIINNNNFAVAGANGAIVELGQLQRCRMRTATQRLFS